MTFTANQIAMLLGGKVVGDGNRTASNVSGLETAKEGDLCFVCENTFFEKGTDDHSGSGIGLVNLQRRLELIYPGKYTYDHHSNNGLYHVEIRLKDLL